MAGHFIVCGMGRMGYRIVNLLLRLGEPVTVVSQSIREEWKSEVQRKGVTLLLGDARDEHLLLQAGLLEARALIAAVDQDLVNIEIALDVKRLCPDLPVVVRVFDQTLAQQMEASFDIRRALAISMLAAPTFAAAAMGERVLGSFRLDHGLLVVGRLTVTPGSLLDQRTAQEVGTEVGLAVLTLEREGEDCQVAPPSETILQAGDRLTLAGSSSDWDRLTGEPTVSKGSATGWRPQVMFLLHSLNPAFWFDFVRHVWRHTSLPLRAIFVALNTLILFSVGVFHICMHLKFIDAFYFIITTVTTVGYGDITPRDFPPALKLYSCLVMLLGSATVATLFSIVTDFIVTARFQQLLGRQRVPQRGHFVVVGLGNVGYRIVEKLRLVGAQVVVIERNANSEFIEAVRAHSPVIIGDARLRETLQKAGVAKARAVIAVTEDDAVNLGAVLEAKRMEAGIRTVARLFDPEFARKVQTALHVDAAMGAFLISAPTFVAAALYPNVRNAFVRDDLLFSVLDRMVGADWQGLRPSQLRAEHAVRILMRKRPGDASFTLANEDTPLGSGEEVMAVVWRQLQP